jgi:hypothetical protein
MLVQDRNHRILLHTTLGLSVLFALVSAHFPVWAQAPSIDLPLIVSKMSQVQHEALAESRAYQLTRKYQVFNNKDSNKDGIPDDQRPKTELLATIDYMPAGQTSYRIDHSTGGMGERAIRHALDHEAELAKTPERMEMTERNYTFSFEGVDQLRGRKCYVLQSNPKRDDRYLLKAQVWVDAENFRILKIHGRPQRSPSFWVKDLDLTLEYNELGGMWMHTTTRADADVRFDGSFTLLANAVSVKPEVTVTQARQKTRRPAAEAAAAAVVHLQSGTH